MTRTAKQQPPKTSRKIKAAIEPIDGPTPEREARGDIVFGAHEEAKRRIKSVKTPLDRLREGGWIDDAQHAAGEKFRKHVYLAGVSGVPKTADLNATGGGSDCSYGMAATELQAHHRAEYRKATLAIGKWRSAVFQDFLTHDCSLEEVGYVMGEKNKMQAIAAAREMVRGKLVLLVDLWSNKDKSAAA